ncbi:hypothetical protein O1L60_14295 [Streptomyces diastatochromogenes]|nr:hypothetical protein [Streptomyces diastatochromogenes]
MYWDSPPFLPRLSGTNAPGGGGNVGGGWFDICWLFQLYEDESRSISAAAASLFASCFPSMVARSSLAFFASRATVCASGSLWYLIAASRFALALSYEVYLGMALAAAAMAVALPSIQYAPLSLYVPRSAVDEATERAHSENAFSASPSQSISFMRLTSRSAISVSCWPVERSTSAASPT